MRVLQNAFKLDDPELVRRFYAHWFALDASVRDLFPPDMGAQRAAFGQALHWVYGELVAQRAEEPVAFLAQLAATTANTVCCQPSTTRCAARCIRPCVTIWAIQAGAPGRTPSTRPPASRST